MPPATGSLSRVYVELHPEDAARLLQVLGRDPGQSASILAAVSCSAIVVLRVLPIPVIRDMRL